MNYLYVYIESYLEGLSPSEKKIRLYLLEHWDEKLNIEKIAKGSYTSKSSVSKYVKKIKYKSLKEFLKEKKFYDETNEVEIDYERIFKYVTENKKKALDLVYQQIETPQIISFARKLMRYEIIYIYGIGYSAYQAQEFNARVARIGINAIYINSRHDVVLKSNNLKTKSAFLFISQSGETKEVMEMAHFSFKQKIDRYLITAEKNSILGKQIDNKIIVPKIYSGLYVETLYSEIVVNLLFDYIYSVILFEDYEDSLDKYNKTRVYFLKGKKDI